MKNVKMEVVTLGKSILKKSNPVAQNKNRKVTFSNTVRLFCTDGKLNTNDTPQLKYVEISIVDKSQGKTSTHNTSNHIFDDCKAEDFLVHKVIYDNDMITEDDTEQDINPDHDAQNDDAEHEVHVEDIEHKEQNENAATQNEDAAQKTQNEDVEQEVQNENSKHNAQNDDSEHYAQNEAIYEPIIFETQNEDDVLDFVVHKVTEHENDSILTEFDSDAESDNLDNSMETQTSLDYDFNSTTKPISKLSIENILEHDKIIAYNDQNSLSSSCTVEAISNVMNLDILIDYRRKDDDLAHKSDDSGKKNDNIVLSPPLQELSLEKIVRAHTDNILCELDISPLNSIQESDSESDISSEDTMIMMTSEECKKNEQHIRQSFLQYQSIKENKVSDISDFNISETDYKLNGDVDLQTNSLDVLRNECIQDNLQEICLTDQSVSDHASDAPLTNGYSSGSNSMKEQNFQVKSKPQPFKSIRTSFLTDKAFCPSEKHDASLTNGFKSAFRTSDNSSCYWDKTLSSVEIPKDVREWKIMLSSMDKNSNSCKNEIEQYDPNSAPAIPERKIRSFLKSDVPCKISRTDELEHFVNESTERVERMRKRYHVSENNPLKFGIVQNSPLRGIRPRFGSTAEILQMMQKKNQSSLVTYDSTRTHMSWPFSDNSKSRIESHEKEHSSSENLYVNQRLPSDYSSPSYFQNTYCDELIHSNVCDHYSISSCSPFMPGEREAPEGASPPRSLTEHGTDQDYSEQYQSSDNVVYYSMKV